MILHCMTLKILLRIMMVAVAPTDGDEGQMATAETELVKDTFRFYKK